MKSKTFTVLKKKQKETFKTSKYLNINMYIKYGEIFAMFFLYLNFIPRGSQLSCLIFNHTF